MNPDGVGHAGWDYGSGPFGPSPLARRCRRPSPCVGIVDLAVNQSTDEAGHASCSRKALRDLLLEGLAGHPSPELVDDPPTDTVVRCLGSNCQRQPRPLPLR